MFHNSIVGIAREANPPVATAPQRVDFYGVVAARPKGGCRNRYTFRLYLTSIAFRESFSPAASRRMK